MIEPQLIYIQNIIHISLDKVIQHLKYVYV